MNQPVEVFHVEFLKSQIENIAPMALSILLLSILLGSAVITIISVSLHEFLLKRVICVNLLGIFHDFQ